MKRKFAVALLAFALAFSTATAVNAAAMTNAQKIQSLVDSKVIVGRDADGKGSIDLALDSQITRAEVATILVRLVGREDLANALKDGNQPFPDVNKNNWAFGEIAAAAAKGENIKPLMIGDENGKFNPEANITYQEVASMLLRAVQPDLDETNMSYPRDYVGMAARVGLLNGTESADYTKPATRKYVFEMLYNAKAIRAGEKLGKDDAFGKDVSLYDTAVKLINEYAKNRTESNYAIAVNAINAAPAEKRAELRQKLNDAQSGYRTGTGSYQDAINAIDNYRKLGTNDAYAKAVEAINKAPELDRPTLRSKLVEAENYRNRNYKNTTYNEAIDAIATYRRTGYNSDREKAKDIIKNAPSQYINELNNRLYDADRALGKTYNDYRYYSTSAEINTALSYIESYRTDRTNRNYDLAYNMIDRVTNSTDRSNLLNMLNDVRNYGNYRNNYYYYNNNYDYRYLPEYKDVNLKVSPYISKNSYSQMALNYIKAFVATGDNKYRDMALDEIKNAPAEDQKYLMDALPGVSYSRYPGGSDAKKATAYNLIDNYRRFGGTDRREKAAEAIREIPVSERQEANRLLEEADRLQGYGNYTDYYYRRALEAVLDYEKNGGSSLREYAREKIADVRNDSLREYLYNRLNYGRK